MTAESETMVTGGVILCGGKSSRMRQPKLSLPFGNELMLPRVVRLLSEVVSPIVVVAGPDQEVPPLGSNVELLRDEQEYLGPLAGLAIGLAALADRVEAAYVSSCDVPLLKPDFIRAVVAALGDRDIAVPRVDGYYHPLAAVYRTALAGAARSLVAQDRLRPLFLIEQSRTRVLEEAELRSVDSGLDSLRNINTPDEYKLALRDAGVSA